MMPIKKLTIDARLFNLACSTLENLLESHEELSTTKMEEQLRFHLETPHLYDFKKGYVTSRQQRMKACRQVLAAYLDGNKTVPARKEARA